MVKIVKVLEHLKMSQGNILSTLKAAILQGNHFLLGTELCGSCLQEVAHIVISYIIDIWGSVQIKVV